MKFLQNYIWVFTASLAFCGAATAQQAVILKATGVSQCDVGLPAPGTVGNPIAIATDLNGHLCLHAPAGGGTSSLFGSPFPSMGTVIGVKDSAGTNMTFLKADASNNLSVTVAGTLPAFATPPLVAQSGTWNVGLSGLLPEYAATPTFKIDQSIPGTTNLVQLGGVLPPFASTPEVVVPGTVSVMQSDHWTFGSAGIVTVGPIGSAATYSGTSSVAKAVGGLQSMEVFRENSGGGTLTGVGLMFDTGQTTPVTLYVFGENPTASVCADNSSFVLSATDRSKLLFNPIALVPSVGVGIAESTAFSQVAITVKNSDSTPSRNLYVCPVVASVLVMTGPELRLTVRVDQY